LHGGSSGEKNRGSDIVLSYGIMKYQDTENYRISNVKFPYKTYCWEYNEGVVYTPFTELINPQRMVNRLGSVMENIINNSKPPTIAYDKDLTDNQDDPNEMLRNLYQGKPLALSTRGRGIHNAITNVAGSLDSTVNVYQGLIEASKLDMDRIIGVNEALRGESAGSEQLVGVTQLQIQKGTLMQAPFYKAIERIFLQIYQSIADVGKKSFK